MDLSNITRTNDYISADDITQMGIENWDAAYTESVYEIGIIIPCIFRDIGNGERELLAGRRRLSSFLKARKRAIEDGSLVNRPWLERAPIVVYEGIDRVAGDVITLLENMERSDNPLHAYQVMCDARARGDWDAVQGIIKTIGRKGAVLFRKYEKIDPQLIQAGLNNQISQTNLHEVATIGLARQALLVEKLATKSRLTETDIKDAKKASAAEVLGQTGYPTPGVVVQDNAPHFLVINGKKMAVYSEYASAKQNLKEGGKLYKLIPQG